MADVGGRARTVQRVHLPGWVTRDRVALAAAVAGPLGACALLGVVRGSLPNADAALVLVLVVVAVAADGDRRAGYVAALSAAVWFDFFLTMPYERFTIERGADARTTVLLLAVGGAVTELAAWGRRQAAVASSQAGYLTGIREATELVSAGGSGTQLAQNVSRTLVRVLGLTSCRFEHGIAGVGQPARLRHDGALTWLPDPGWDVDRRGLPTGVDIELVVESGGHLVGRFLMRAAAGNRPSRAERLVAVTLANQVGPALADTTRRPA